MNALLIKYDRCLWFVILPYFPMQSVLCIYNTLIINICLCVKIPSGDKRGTKIRIPKERKTIKPFQKHTLKCQGQNLSLAIFFVCPSLSLGFRVRFCSVSAKHYNHHISKFKISRQRVNLAYQKKKTINYFRKPHRNLGDKICPSPSFVLSLAIPRFHG